MHLEVDEPDETLAYRGSLDVSSAAELGRMIADHLREHTQTILDLSDVTGCDAAGLQMLYAAKKQAQKFGKQFAVREAALEIQDKAAHLGLCLDEFALEGAHE